MNTELIKAILAVDALNSWVRSESHRQHPFGKDAIYWLKRQAIREAHESGAVWFRGIEAEAKCNRCSGTGIYTDWNGFSRGQCRNCNNGTTKLRFIESRIELAPDHTLTWHHPESLTSKGLTMHTSIHYYLGASKASNWQPNTTGKDLALAEVIDHLNVAERYFQKRPENYYDEQGDGPYNVFQYALYLGSVSELCCICKERPKAVSCGLSHQLIDWSAPVCQECEPKKDWDWLKHETFPHHLITPAIAEWHARHAYFYNNVIFKRWPAWSTKDQKEIIPLTPAHVTA